jgi:FkbM family methyltransferase
MRFESLNGKLVQMGHAGPRLWWPFVSGWLLRQKNGFVPCIFSDCKKLLLVPSKEFYESYFFFCEHADGRHELNYFLAHLKPADVFYDIGAFRGAYSAAAKLRLRENINVHVFEPLPGNVQAIRRICELNGFENFQINPLAVSDGNSLTGGVNELDAMLRLGDEASSAKTEFTAITLDEYIAGGGPPPTVMKIDVDGFELHVLRGAQKCLAQFRPRLWLEVHPGFLAAQEKSPEDVFKLLRETGYSISFFDDYNLPAAKTSYHVWCE